MAKEVSKLVLGLLALFVALGDLDGWLGVGSAVGVVQVLAGLFVVVHLILHIKDISVFFTLEACLLFLLIIVLALAQLNYGQSSYDISTVNLKLIVCSVFFLVLGRHLRRYPDHANAALSVFSFGCVILCVVALVVPGVAETYKGQFVVLGENPNSTSTRMVVAFLFVFFYLLHNNLKSYRLILCCMALAMLAFIVVKSGSRGSLIAMILSSFLLALLAPLRQVYKLGLLLVMAVGLVFVAQSVLSLEGVGERWINAFQGDTAGRSQIWTSAFKIFLQHPWLGVGEGGYFTEIYSHEYRYIDAHNLFIYVVVSGGLIGFSLFMMFVARLVNKALIAFSAGDAFPIILLFNMLFIAAKTGGVLTYLLLWFVFAMVFGGQYREVQRPQNKKGSESV